MQSMSNGKSAQPLPTGIYGALDTMRREGQIGGDPDGAQPPKPERPPTPSPQLPPMKPSAVPQSVTQLPRPRSLRMQWRYVRVLWFAFLLFGRVLFWQILAKRYFRGYVERTNDQRFVRYARSFRKFAVSLGGVFIKLGQFVSTRVDALPEEVVRELETLQDEVPTIPFKHIRQVLVAELGEIGTRFSRFDETPIAAASLGQAHKAQLHNGDKVVVKVQRPGIRETCYTDLAALRVVAWVAMKFQFIAKRADANALVEEFGRVLLEELSYHHEARNAKVFAQFFAQDMGVYIPAIYEAHSTDCILTLEDVSSIKITDFDALDAAGIDRKAVATRLMDTYLRQIFELFLFHADPHPGNLFIYPLPPQDGDPPYAAGKRPFYLIFIDFGMTGTLTRAIADGMVNTLTAILARDPTKMVRAYDELGFILPGADLDRITEAAQAAFNEVWGLSMTEIRDMDFDRAAHIAGEFSDLIKAMPFYIPQDFVYLGRTLSILSGMCTTLDPTFNPWQALEPYAQQLVARGFGVNLPANGGTLDALTVVQSILNGEGQAVLQTIGNELLRRANPLTSTNAAIAQLQRGEIKVIAEPSAAHKAQLQRLESVQKSTNRAVIFGSVLIAATLLYTHGALLPALIGYGFCGASAVYGFFRNLN